MTITSDRFWFEQKLEEVINNSIASCYPARWTENTITEELLRDIEGYLNNNAYTDTLTGLTKIEFSGYKLSGKPETDFGDIALLTTIRFDNGMKLKGVANFEAKKRLQNDFKYRSQSRDKQYKTIVKNTPYSQLLLYDFEPITQHIKPTYDFEYWDEYYRNRHLPMLFTKCVATPLYMVMNGSTVTRNNLRHGRTLSEQLSRRIFYGVDLHYDQKIKDRVMSFDNDNHPMFVAVLKVVHGNTAITDDRDDFEINDNLYSTIQ